MRRQAGLLLLSILLGLTAVAGDWGSWRGVRGDGISEEKDWNPAALAPTPKIAWQAQLGVGYSAVAVANDRLYSIGNRNEQDVVVCLNAVTGETIWEFAYACPAGQAGNYPGPRATPVLDGPAVFTYSRDGQLHCLKAQTGEVIWKKNLTSEFGARPPSWAHSATPRIEGGLLIVNAGKSGTAFRKQTGEKIWGGEPGPCGYAAPVLFQAGTRRAVALFSFKTLEVLDPADGRSLGSFPWETGCDVNAADPVDVGDGRLFISSGYDKGCALIEVGADGIKEVWRNKNLRNHFSSSVLIGGHLYGVDGQAGRGELRCLDVSDGSVKWSAKTGFGNLMAANGKLIFLNEGGRLIIAEANPNVYSEVSAAQTPLSRICWTMPVLSHGRIYCRNDKGHLVCVDVRP